MRLVFCLENRGSSSYYRPEHFYGRGLGGGESALYLLTRQLAKMGHEVRVYNPAGDGLEHEGVYHYHSNQFNPNEYCDAFILFRTPNYAIRHEINTGVRLFWSVDQQTQGDYRADVFPFVDYTVTISPYHTKYHIGRYGVNPDKIQHIDLGVSLEDYQQDIEKIPGRLIYTSVEARGLWHLPRLFQRIKERYIKASLVIMGDYTLWGANFTGLESAPERFGHLRDVSILGAIPRRELVQQQLRADILAMPNPYEELFCIAAAEAQVAGAVPVTTDIGALSTTVDTGFLNPLRPGMPQYDKWFVDTIANLLSDRSELEKLQKEARKKANERFSYERIGKEWIALIKKLRKGEKIQMAKQQCEYVADGKQCGRMVNIPARYCWQHRKMMPARPKNLAPTDLRNRITKNRIIHLGCKGHNNTLEIQVGGMPGVRCLPGYDPGEVDEDTSIVLLDVLPLWTLEETKGYLNAWAEAEIIAFLPLNLREYQRLGQVRSWTEEELKDLGFEVEVLEGFHILPEGKVDAAWGIR